MSKHRSPQTPSTPLTGKKKHLAVGGLALTLTVAALGWGLLGHDEPTAEKGKQKTSLSSPQEVKKYDESAEKAFDDVANEVKEEIPVEPIENEPRIANASELAKGKPAKTASNRLIITDVGVNAPLDKVGKLVTAKTASMDIPENVSRVGWYKESAKPQWVAGPSIISGHVSDTRDRPGALWNLRNAKKGMKIKWVQDGKEWTYVVVGKSYHKRSGELPQEMFYNPDEKYLYIVTCANRKDLGGGRFSYQDNLVVKARLYGVIDDKLPE